MSAKARRGGVSHPSRHKGGVSIDRSGLHGLKGRMCFVGASSNFYLMIEVVELMKAKTKENTQDIVHQQTESTWLQRCA